jgi:RecA-family ATPase
MIPTIEQLNRVDEHEAELRREELRTVAHAEKVKRYKEETRARRQAAREVEAEERSATGAQFSAATVSEIRAQPETPRDRVNQLVPWASSILVVAQRKVGKTTFVLNLGRALTTGEDFLGEFGVQKVTGRIAILNYEVNGQTLARWADEIGDLDDLILVNLRGCRNPLGTPEDRRELAGMMRGAGVEVIIVDTFARAFTGASQNDAGEVIRFLSDLDTFARQECGATDLVLTTHAGWKDDRTRGSSALEDWADSIITLTALDREPWTRFVAARGRDTELEEHTLTYDPVARRLRLGEQSTRREAQRDAKAEQILPFVVKAVTTAEDPLTSAAMITSARLLGGQGHDDEFRKAARLAESRKLILIEDQGAGKAKLHRKRETPDDPK